MTTARCSRDPLMECKISQGVTTVVTGNCGISLAPLSIDRYPPPPLDIIGREPKQFFPTFDAYLSALDRDPPALNAVCQVGHSTLRVGAMDRLDRAATTAEIDTMRRTLEQSLEQGAIGLSTGLYYPPAKDAPTDEIVTLTKAVRAFGGIHTTHMRDEASHLIESVNETISIGQAADVPVVISHHKATGIPNHGRVTETLELIKEARKRQKLGLDAYPYVASSTMLDPRRIPLASKVIVTWSKSPPGIRRPDAGRDREDSSAPRLDDAAAQLLPAGAIYFMMSEDDVRRVLSFPHTMIGSDGLPHDEHPHPRLWGTFPRVLGHYARDVKLFHAGGGGAPHDGALRRAVRTDGSRRAARRRLRRSGAVRSGNDRGQRDVRQAEDAGQRHRRGLRQRPLGLEGRPGDRQPPRPRAAAAAARHDGRRHGGGVNAIATRPTTTRLRPCVRPAAAAAG